MNQSKKTFLTTNLVAVLSFWAATISAQDLPAVSDLNGKLDYEGGSMNSSEGHNFSGSLSLPLGEKFGFQADGLYSRIDDSDFYGSAGHLFWRNPDVGLLGLAGGYLQRTGVDTYQVGAEGEYYLDRFTFGFFGGLGSISYDKPAPFIDTNPTEFIGKISVGYYVIDDLLLRASYATAFQNGLAKVELEYQTPINGLALTAEGALGEHDYDHWLVGVRYYFGSKKSLRDRHRQDDPPGLMQQILHGLGVYGAEYNRKGNRYSRAHPGSGNYGSYGSGISHVTIFTGNPALNANYSRSSFPER
jgi:hypothetical protein